MESPEDHLPIHRWAHAIKERDNYTCVKCGSTQSLLAHHILPRADGGLNTLNNGETQCARCHKLTHLAITPQQPKPAINASETLSQRLYTKKKQSLMARMARLPAEIDAQIVALAAAQGVSMNAMTIQLLQEALLHRARQPPS